MLLVNIEVSIIGTSLVSITDDLHGFSQNGWVVTGYLITYTGECRLCVRLRIVVHVPPQG
jgi:hypothetical protein